MSEEEGCLIESHGPHGGWDPCPPEIEAELSAGDNLAAVASALGGTSKLAWVQTHDLNKRVRKLFLPTGNILTHHHVLAM